MCRQREKYPTERTRCFTGFRSKNTTITDEVTILVPVRKIEQIIDKVMALKSPAYGLPSIKDESERCPQVRFRMTCHKDESRDKESYHEEDESSGKDAYIRDCFYNSKSFQHFDYALELVRDCSSRVGMAIPDVVKESYLPPRNVIVKIIYTGEVSKNNLKLVAKRKEMKTITADQTIWEVTPFILFENRHSLKSAIENFITEEANHKILVKSNNAGYDDLARGNIKIVDTDHVQEAICSVLEEPLRNLLDDWLQRLEADQSKQTLRIISEIKSIRKQMAFEESVKTFAFKSSMPYNVKEHLFSKAEVTSFGLWQNSRFKVFVKKETNIKTLRDEIEAMNTLFFRIHKLEIESKKLVGKFNMKQGDILLSSPSDNAEHSSAGTLGGFVTKPNDPESKYALTCNHLFPEENLPAYAGAFMQFQRIGRCVFTTREHNCDFAAIKIDKTMSQDCEITFRREDDKKTNAHVYEGSIGDLGVLHKIRAGSNVTKGTILSEEFYLKNLIDDDNRDSIFFVQGTGESFSKEGDSGSLVFSRPRHAKQNYVNVVGMIYGSKVIVDNEDDSRDNQSSSFKNQDEEHLIGNHTEPEFISSCYRIRPALDFFRRKIHVPVKFKDDLSTSSSSSSSDDDF